MRAWVLHDPEHSLHIKRQPEPTDLVEWQHAQQLWMGCCPASAFTKALCGQKGFNNLGVVWLQAQRLLTQQLFQPWQSEDSTYSPEACVHMTHRQTGWHHL